MTQNPPEDRELEALARKLDHYKMGQVIEGLPRQIETALVQPLPALPRRKFNRAIIVGMGGSALPADVVASAFRKDLTAPLSIVRSYDLQQPVDDNCLVIASSFSGGTEETLSAIEPFAKGAENVVVVTAGGRLSALATERGYPLILIPKELEPAGFQPRSAVGYFVTFFARVLAGVGVMNDVTARLGGVPGFLRGIDFRQDAESVARWLQDRMPVVYTDEVHLNSIARITKIKFNENSKRPAWFNALPEANHNEMIGFMQQLGKFGLLYLHDPASHPRIRQRFEVMKRVFAESSLDNVAFREWILPGETTLQKIFAGMAFAERCSYYLALLDGMDPTPVDMVERFKQALVSNKT